MSFHQGTATDYLDMLAKLVAFATGRGVSAAVVNAGGTGYTPGDVVTVAGGTHSVVATVEVTAVAAGVVTSVRVLETGTYTVDPTTTGNAVTGGTGASLTLNLTMADVGWTERRESFYVESAVVAAGGTGYGVNNVLFVTGGTFTEQCAFKVATVSAGGVVTSVTLDQKGEYTVGPSNPVATTSGAGTGCTLTLTLSADRNVILEGEGAGAEEIFVGIRTYVNTGAHNWELSGFTGYQSLSNFVDQPGISPGRYDDLEDGHYVPLNNASIDFWLYVSTRRIVGVFKMGSTYTNMYLGQLNAFATSDEYPYPLFVAGCSSLVTRLFSSTSISLSGLTDFIGHTATTVYGPASIRDPGGTWKQLQNSRLSGGGRSNSSELVCFPAGMPNMTGIDVADRGSSGLRTTLIFIPGTDIPGVPVGTLNQTPGTVDFVSPLWPAILIESQPVRQVLGELDGVYWVSANGEATDLLTEDTIEAEGFLHHVFQNCNRTDQWSHLAVRRS